MTSKMHTANKKRTMAIGVWNAAPIGTHLHDLQSRQAHNQCQNAVCRDGHADGLIRLQLELVLDLPVVVHIQHHNNEVILRCDSSNRLKIQPRINGAPDNLGTTGNKSREMTHEPVDIPDFDALLRDICKNRGITMTDFWSADACV